MTPACRFCGAPLDALARHRGLDSCGASPCRHRAAEAHTAVMKAVARREVLAALAEQETAPGKPPAAVVWLRHWEPELIPLDEAERAAHRAHLEAVVEQEMVIDRTRLAESSADDRHAQGARLCGQCRGRCCAHGAGWRAFIDLALLSRWIDRHPGSGYADAVDAYMAMLPAEHVREGCLYQTAMGCAMPREDRAEICNGFACEALQQVQEAAAREPGARLVAITFHRDRVERAAVISPEATLPIRLEPANRGNTS